MPFVKVEVERPSKFGGSYLSMCGVIEEKTEYNSFSFS